MTSVNDVEARIAAFRRKYYLNLLLRGSILTGGLVLAYYLLAAVLEYNLWLGRVERLVLLVSFFAVAGYGVMRFLRAPLAWWLRGRGIGQEQSARLIGSSIPAIQDRLLNFLQLSGSSGGALVEASLAQKAAAFEGYRFDSIINLSENRRYLKYLLIPLGLFLALVVLNRQIFTQSTSRILRFDQEFTPQAPFSFVVQNNRLVAFPNEDFVLQVALKGEALPEAVYLVSGNQRLKMEAQSAGLFVYTFEKIQQEFPFRFEAAGFLSDPHVIQLVNRPELLQLTMDVRYPAYTGRAAQRLINTGNAEVPEGTRITWNIRAANTESAQISFSGGAPIRLELSDNQLFTFGKGFFESDAYSLALDNENSRNKDRIGYRIEVIKDAYPGIAVQHQKDSVLYQSIMLAGTVEDDYGLTRLQLRYRMNAAGEEVPERVIDIPLDRQQPQQNFFYAWRLDSLKLKAGDHLEYHLTVWDNDGVHGPKATSSAAYRFDLPDASAFKADITKSQAKTETEIEKSLSRAKSLKESIQEAEQKLKGKQSLDWQDQKMLEDLIQQKKSLDQVIQQLKDENRMLEEKKDAFSEQNERIKEKAEQIQKLMDELLDEETKKLFEELEKMLKDNQDPNQIQKMLEKMDRKEINIEKELERTLELFKRLQYDYKLDEAIQEMTEQIQKQEELLDQTETLAGEKKTDEKGKEQQGKDGKSEQLKGDKGDEPKTSEELAQEQEELTERAESFEKNMEELNKLGEELDKKEDLPGKEDINQLKEQEKQSKESLEQGQPKKATAPQKKSLDKMKEMLQQLNGLQNSMTMEIDQQNLESLRQIIHGLIKLSYDEEAIMKEFMGIQQSDPRYVVLSQQQLKIQDDSKVLADSLLELSKKDAFMGSIVTREVGELNDHLRKAVDNIKDRRKSYASTDMQLSMTSINNLALMLNDHFDQMMDMMQNAQPSLGKKKQKGKQSLGEMQMQLNQQMEQLKNSGKSGRQLSEELAKMAAEQERIRRALSEMQEKLKQEGGKPLGNDIPGQMEQTEMDLVNKQLSEQTLRRQKDILTRLLESEKSMREQEMDEERKGETAKDYQKELPKAFEEYLRLKEKEVELLKTVPPRLYPYYKKEVNEYFKRLGYQK